MSEDFNRDIWKDFWKWSSIRRSPTIVVLIPFTIALHFGWYYVKKYSEEMERNISTTRATAYIETDRK